MAPRQPVSGRRHPRGEWIAPRRLRADGGLARQEYDAAGRDLPGFLVDDRADLVIAGLGGPGRPASADDLLGGLRRALGLVRLGGKIVLLSRLGIETIRQALRGPDLPRGDWDKAVARADIYIAASADADDLDELGLIPLDRPEQAAKLAALAPSFLAISQVDRARPTIRDEADVS